MDSGSRFVLYLGSRTTDTLLNTSSCRSLLIKKKCSSWPGDMVSGDIRQYYTALGPHLFLFGRPNGWMDEWTLATAAAGDFFRGFGCSLLHRPCIRTGSDSDTDWKKVHGAM